MINEVTIFYVPKNNAIYVTKDELYGDPFFNVTQAKLAFWSGCRTFFVHDAVFLYAHGVRHGFNVRKDIKDTLNLVGTSTWQPHIVDHIKDVLKTYPKIKRAKIFESGEWDYYSLPLQPDVGPKDAVRKVDTNIYYRIWCREDGVKYFCRTYNNPGKMLLELEHQHLKYNCTSLYWVDAFIFEPDGGSRRICMPDNILRRVNSVLVRYGQEQIKQRGIPAEKIIKALADGSYV